MKRGKANKIIDWVITALPSQDDYKTNPNRSVVFETIGFDKDGSGEIVVHGRSCNHNKIKNLINTFGSMLRNGEEFDDCTVHTIGNNAWTYKYRFFVSYTQDEDGKNVIYLMPDFDWDIDVEHGKCTIKPDIQI